MNRGCLVWAIVSVLIYIVLFVFCCSCSYKYTYTVKNLDNHSIIEGKAKYLWNVGDTIQIEPTCERIVILYKDED